MDRSPAALQCCPRFFSVDPRHRCGFFLVRNLSHTIQTAVSNVTAKTFYAIHVSSLIESVARGESAAFEQLYDRYCRTLYALLLRILLDADDAQETLQETFVQAWNQAARFDPARGSEAAWLISMARSRGIDRLRARRVRSRKEEDAGREISIEFGTVAGKGNPDALLRAERQQAVRGALAALPESQRQALELAYFEGLSQSEIAARLKEPLGTVKTRMQLGMKKLRGRLKEMK